MAGKHDRREGKIPMNYTASISDFFKSPKWSTNLLLGGVCMLIPLAGPIVLGGWHITVLWARNNRNPGHIPEFDFSQFGKYLERGVWPFLVGIVVSLMIMPVMLGLMLVMMSAVVFFAHGSSSPEPEPLLVILGVLGSICMFALVLVAVTVASMPFVLRATITQDFAQAFQIVFFKRFVALVWKELILAALFTLVAGFVLTIIGLMACYVGMFFTMTLHLFAWHHLERQLYDLYLSRGGQPVPLSLKLRDGPPPLPAG